MKVIQSNKSDHQKNILGPVVAGVVGAAAVAGMAVAATMALGDKKTRERVKKMLVNVKDLVIDYAETKI